MNLIFWRLTKEDFKTLLRCAAWQFRVKEASDNNKMIVAFQLPKHDTSVDKQMLHEIQSVIEKYSTEKKSEIVPDLQWTDLMKQQAEGRSYREPLLSEVFILGQSNTK